VNDGLAHARADLDTLDGHGLLLRGLRNSTAAYPRGRAAFASVRRRAEL